MKVLEKYRIDIYKLSNKVHEYEFEIESEFFDCFEFSEIKKGKGNCQIKLNKTDSLISIDFEIDVSVQLVCDRSLDNFSYPIRLTDQIMYKYGEEEAELSDNVFVITKSTQAINLSHPIFELISVAVPIKKLHPRYDEQNEDDNDGMIYQSESDETTEEEVVDPRWNALKNLNNNIK